MAKLTKEETDYSLGMAHSHCGKVFHEDKGYCAHYQGAEGVRVKGTCEIVNGEINPLYWCKKWAKA